MGLPHAQPSKLGAVSTDNWLATGLRLLRHLIPSWGALRWTKPCRWFGLTALTVDSAILVLSQGVLTSGWCHVGNEIHHDGSVLQR